MAATEAPTSTNPPGRRRALRLLLQLLVSVALLALALTQVSIRDVFYEAGSIPAPTWALGLAVSALAWALDSVRLVFLARWVAHPLPLRRAMHINLVSNIYALALFGWVGGGGYRAWRFWREGWDLEASVLVLALDRILCIGGFCITAAVLVGASRLAPEVGGAVVLGVVVASALLAALGRAIPSEPPRGALPEGRWLRLRAALGRLTAGGMRCTGAGLALGFLMTAVYPCWTVVVARDLGLTLPALEIAAIGTIISIAQQLPVSWFGTGIREYGFETLLSRQGAAPGTGVAIGAAWLVVGLSWVAVSLVVHLLLPANAPPRAHDAAPPPLDGV